MLALVSRCRIVLIHIFFSPQGPVGCVIERGVGTPSTPSGISWEVAGGNSGSIFSKNFANLCLLRLTLDGGTFFFGFSTVLLVGVP